MKFKAKILGMSYSSVYRDSVSKEPLDMIFLFGKNRIFFTDKMNKQIKELTVQPFDKLKNGTPYTLHKTYHEKNDEKMYQIELSDLKYYIQLNRINKLRLLWIHEKTWIQKEPLAIIAIIISIFGLVISIFKK